MSTTIHSRYNREAKDAVDLDRLFGVASACVGVLAIAVLAFMVWNRFLDPVTEKVSNPIAGIASEN